MGQEINRSLWVIILPLFFIFSIGAFILLLPYIDLSSIGVPADLATGVTSGIAQALPFIGVGFGIAMLYLVFAIIRRKK
jgi:hypothetical protein